MKETKKSKNLIERLKTVFIDRWREIKTWKGKMSRGAKISLLILGYIISAFVGVLAQIPIDKFILHREKVKLWSVTGGIKLEDSDEFERENTVLSIKPPEQELYTDGQFVIYKIPIKLGEGGKPSLLIKKDSYKLVQIVLEEKPPDYFKKFGLTDYLIDFQEKQRIIQIGEPIILERENVPR